MAAHNHIGSDIHPVPCPHGVGSPAPEVVTLHLRPTVGFFLV